jgi:tubulin polyglutamylase TTLL9
LFDSDLKPFVLEVNASPSMSAENPEDRQLKTSLLQDVLTIVDPWHERTTPDLPASVGGFDLIYNNGIITTTAILGLANPHLT